MRAETITATQVYTYNGDGLLVAQSIDGVETSLVWDQALPIPQVLATSDGVKTLYGLERLGVLQGGAWRYPQHDALGSVRQWTDAAGAVLATQSYSPFGVPRAALAVAPWGFTGEWHDRGGLVYLRARWYNAAWGRFTQVDPMAASSINGAARQAYLYALGNPLAHVDPSGLQPPVGGPPKSNAYAYRAFTQREERLLAHMLYLEMSWIGVYAYELDEVGLQELEAAKKMGYRADWMQAGAWVAINTAKAKNLTLTKELLREARYAKGAARVRTAYERELWDMALYWAHQVYWREYTGEIDPTGGAQWFFHAHEDPRGQCTDPGYIGERDWRTKQEVFLAALRDPSQGVLQLPAEWRPIPGYLDQQIPCWLPRLYYVQPGDVHYLPYQ